MSKFANLKSLFEDFHAAIEEYVIKSYEEAVRNLNDWTKGNEKWTQIAKLSSSDFADAIFPVIRKLSIQTGKPFLEYCDDVIDCLLRGEDQADVLYYFDRKLIERLKETNE